MVWRRKADRRGGAGFWRKAFAVAVRCPYEPRIRQAEAGSVRMIRGGAGRF